MICEKKRIAYCKFPAEDLIYCPNDMIGKQCGKRQTLFLKVTDACMRYITCIRRDSILSENRIQNHQKQRFLCEFFT